MSSCDGIVAAAPNVLGRLLPKPTAICYKVSYAATRYTPPPHMSIAVLCMHSVQYRQIDRQRVTERAMLYAPTVGQRHDKQKMASNGLQNARRYTYKHSNMIKIRQMSHQLIRQQDMHRLQIYILITQFTGNHANCFCLGLHL